MLAEKKQGLVWLYRFVTPHRSRIFLLLLLSLTASALVLLQPYLVKILIDDGLLAKSFATLLAVATAIFSVGIASTCLTGVNRYLHTRLSGTILFQLRESVYSHLQTLSPDFYSRQRTGDILSRMDGDIAELQRFAVDGLFASFSGVLGLIGAVTIMFLLSWQLALLLLLLIPLQWLYLRVMRPRVEKQTRKMREHSANISSFLTETLSSMKQIQSAVAEERELNRLNHLNKFYLDDLLKLQWIEFATSAIPSTLTSFTRGMTFIIGGYWVIQGQFALGALIAFTIYLGMAVGPVQTLLGLYMAWQRFTVSFERVQLLMNYQPDVAQIQRPLVPETLKGELYFEALSFSYVDHSVPIFNCTSAHIPAARKVGIYGPSGIGKSTLTDLIMRHFSPTDGRILVDHQDIASFDLRDWRRNIALVAQDIVLFHGTIADNIRYNVPGADDDQVAEVAARANLSSFISNLPEGLNTLIGERGGQLSGGQKQRIALARALLQKPLLIIFDEATSDIDLDNEQQIMEEVDSLFNKTTRLIISHRDTPILDADLFLTIVQNRIHLSTNAPDSNYPYRVGRHA